MKLNNNDIEVLLRVHATTPAFVDYLSRRIGELTDSTVRMDNPDQLRIFQGRARELIDLRDDILKARELAGKRT